MITKICKVCQKEKELKEFYSQPKKKKDGTPYSYYNPECKECTKNRSMKWQNKNPDKVTLNNHKQAKRRKEELKLYRIENIKKYQDTLKKWQYKNKDKVKIYNLKRSNKNHKISKNEWKACKEYFNYLCAYCGMSEQEHKMKYSQQLHKEHVNHEGENDLSNCVPACKECNGSKSQHNLYDWYNQTNDNYTYERLEKIHTWLKVDYNRYIE